MGKEPLSAFPGPTETGAINTRSGTLGGLGAAWAPPSQVAVVAGKRQEDRQLLRVSAVGRE